jgi:hypothetical protein
VTQTHRPTTADVIAWFKDEKARREGAEARIAALESDLRAAAALLFTIQENHGSVCANCIPSIQFVLSRPGVAALSEDE